MTTGEPLYETLSDIVRDCQYQEIDGIAVDMCTANVVVTVADALNPANRAKLLALGVANAADISWKITAKH